MAFAVRRSHPYELVVMDGRDDELHIVRDGQWHRWRVRDFVKLRGQGGHID